jgi:hypothetical protein
MPDHARPDSPRRKRFVPALAALGVATVYGTFLGVTLERTRPAGESVPDVDQPDLSRAPVYVPEGLTAADRAPSVPGPSPSPSQPLSSPFVGSAPTTHPIAPTAKPSPTPTPTPTGDGKDAIRKGLDDMLPEVKNLPRWALPIVAKVQKHAVKGTVVQARVDGRGTLYVWGTIKAPKPGGSILDAVFEKPGKPKPKPKKHKHAARVGVEILLTVEDPTKATPADPATVTVTALAPTADMPVVATAQITSPSTTTADAIQTVRQAVADAVDSAPADPTPDPTPDDPPTVAPDDQLAPAPTPDDPPTVDPAVYLLLRDQGPFVRHKEDVPHEGSLPDLYGL